MTKTHLFAARHYAVDDMAAAQEWFHSRQWSDGLPIVPPTPEMVGRCLDWALLPADHLIGVEPVRERAITAEKVAINAVMAGCLPMHFPVVVAALTAMLREPFVLHGATSSTGGCAVLIVINGPVRQEQNMDATFSALGLSDRATTVIGRAVRLVLYNLLDVRPGEVDRSTLGHPGKISYCLSEDEEHSAWLPLAEERGIPPLASAVTVMAAGAPRQIMNEWTTEPEELLDTYVAEIRANMRHYSIWPGNYAIVVPPQLRTHFDRAGWSKADIRKYVYPPRPHSSPRMGGLRQTGCGRQKRRPRAFGAANAGSFTGDCRGRSGRRLRRRHPALVWENQRSDYDRNRGLRRLRNLSTGSDGFLMR